MQLAAICVCERVPKCSLLFQPSETGDIPDFSCKHPSRLQEEQNIIKPPALWVCAAGHCVASPVRLFADPLFFGFFVFAPSLRRVSPKTAKLASHNELWVFLLLLWGTFHSQDVSCTHSRDFSDVCCWSAAVLSVSKGGICVYVPILWCWTSRWRPTDAGCKKKTKLDSAQKQRAEQTQGRDLEWKIFQAGAPSAFTLEP